MVGKAMGEHGEYYQRRKRNRKALLAALGITSGVLVVEVIGGLLIHSLALLADAGHMFADVGALSLSYLAARFALRPATPQKTYGYYRTEILAALLNGVILVIVALFIFHEAYGRFREIPEVRALPMLIVAFVGLLANIASGFVLFRFQGESLNVRGAFLHVRSDAMASMGVITAAVIMLTTAWYYADPVISVIIGGLILYSSWGLLKESTDILLESTPAHISLDTLEKAMKEIPGVKAVHDIHVWSITSGLYSMSGHVVLDSGYRGVMSLEEGHKMLRQLRQLLHDRFGVEHTTFQIEDPGLEIEEDA